MDVRTFGPLPTPGVAMMTRSMRADLGVMISASHNAYADNGIKLFGPDGYKLSDEIELKIEAMMDEALDEGLAPSGRAGPGQADRRRPGPLCRDRQGRLPASDLSLQGLRIAIDCANGAGLQGRADDPVSNWGPRSVPSGVEPNGTNINDDCGSTHPGDPGRGGASSTAPTSASPWTATPTG